MKNLKKIKGDASFRTFFRKKNKNYNSIVVFTKKDKFKNLIIYDAINKILNRNKILAPNLYHENYNKHYIEIQDFGDVSILRILKDKRKSKLLYYKKIIKLLSKIQSIKNRSIKDLKKNKYSIPKYEKKILINEANLFCEWYVKKKLSKKKSNRFIMKYKKLIKKLTLNLKLKNDIFVHRDFHVSNLMLINNQIGVLDSQDALIGNKAYDLASLIDDVRFKTSKPLKKKIYNLYVKNKKKIEKNKIKNDFEILSILRNLKIIGIFNRLSLRDGKKKYLKFIPYAWKLIRMRLNENSNSQDLKNLLSENFKKKLYEN